MLKKFIFGDEEVFIVPSEERKKNIVILVEKLLFELSEWSFPRVNDFINISFREKISVRFMLGDPLEDHRKGWVREYSIPIKHFLTENRDIIDRFELDIYDDGIVFLEIYVK